MYAEGTQSGYKNICDQNFSRVSTEIIASETCITPQLKWVKTNTRYNNTSLSTE